MANKLCAITAIVLTANATLSGIAKAGTHVPVVKTQQEQERYLHKASIKLTGSETEAKRKSLAKITADEAKQTVLKHFQSTPLKVELDDENGYLVYSVDLVVGGKSPDIKVDAGNGTILYDDMLPEDYSERKAD